MANPFSAILSSTSTPASSAVKHSNRPAFDLSPPLEPVKLQSRIDENRESVLSYKALEKDSPEALFDRLVELEKKNLSLQIASGTFDEHELRHRIQILEAKNKALDFSSEQYLAASIRSDAPPIVIPDVSIAYDERVSHSGDANWRDYKSKMTNSIGRSRYSLALRLSMGGHEGVITADLRRSIESSNVPLESAIETIERKSFSTEGQHENFIEFCVIGADPDVITGTKKPTIDKFQSASVIYKYPQYPEPLFIENIAEFAFPTGSVPLYVILDNERSTGVNVGPMYDQYQVMQFSDSAGTPTYACCMVTTEIISDASAVLVKNLTDVQVSIAAAAILCKFFRGIVAFKKAVRGRCNSERKDNEKFRRFSTHYMKRSRSFRSGGIFESVKETLYCLMRSRKSSGSANRPINRPSSGISLSPQKDDVSDLMASPGRRRSANAATSTLTADDLAGVGDGDSAVSETSSVSLEPLGLNNSPAGRRRASSGRSLSSSDVPKTETALLLGQGSRKRASSVRSILSAVTADDFRGESRAIVVAQRAYCVISNSPSYTFLFKVVLFANVVLVFNGIRIRRYYKRL
jgi:hypothetical protein